MKYHGLLRTRLDIITFVHSSSQVSMRIYWKYLSSVFLKPTKELQDSFRFKLHILVSKIYKVCLCSTFGTFSTFQQLFLSYDRCVLYKLQLKNTNHKKKATPETEESIIYVKAEDEIFHKVFWYSFPVPLLLLRFSSNRLNNVFLIQKLISVVFMVLLLSLARPATNN